MRLDEPDDTERAIESALHDAIEAGVIELVGVDSKGRAVYRRTKEHMSRVSMDDLQAATEAAIEAMERETTVALLLLAQTIHEAAPEARYVVLENSDQGDWKSLFAVLDEGGATINLGDEVDDALCDITTHLYDGRSYLWDQFIDMKLSKGWRDALDLQRLRAAYKMEESA